MFRAFFRRLVPGGKSDELKFCSRSIKRNWATDRRRAGPVVTAIQAAIEDTDKERLGLTQRVEDALARAAVTLGNNSDEYLEREPVNDLHQTLFSQQISNGERRLVKLNETLSRLRSLEAIVVRNLHSPAPAKELQGLRASPRSAGA